MNNLGKGALGEFLAEKYLVKNGYKILAKNAKFAGCELDIVAELPAKVQKKNLKIDYKEGRIKSKAALDIKLGLTEDLIVFVEVKYSSTRVYGEPYERVDGFKQRQIIKASEAFLFRNQLNKQCRFDVISIVGEEIKHIVNAF